jgi:hypothetical protein
MKKRILLFLIPVLLAASLAFGFTRDWDESDPVDHTLNSRWPAEIREVMVDVAERLDDIMNGFTSGETVVDFDVVPMNNRAADPTAVPDTGNLYTKDVAAVAELFYQDENSNEIQLTSGGAINASSQCSTMWPIGSVYIAVVSTNPNTLLGCGTWSAFGAGKVLVSLDSGDTDFDTVEETGGSKTRTLTTTELPAHTHTVTASLNGAGGGGTCPQTHTSQACSDSFTSNSSGTGSSFSVVQPYITVYIWKRTA